MVLSNVVMAIANLVLAFFAWYNIEIIKDIYKATNRPLLDINLSNTKIEEEKKSISTILSIEATGNTPAKFITCECKVYPKIQNREMVLCQAYLAALFPTGSTLPPGKKFSREIGTISESDEFFESANREELHIKIICSYGMTQREEFWTQKLFHLRRPFGNINGLLTYEEDYQSTEFSDKPLSW
jgi:hypothetical protein